MSSNERQALRRPAERSTGLTDQALANFQQARARQQSNLGLGNARRRQSGSDEEDDEDEVDMLVHPDNARIAHELQAAEYASMYNTGNVKC